MASQYEGLGKGGAVFPTDTIKLNMASRSVSYSSQKFQQKYVLERLLVHSTTLPSVLTMRTPIAFVSSLDTKQSDLSVLHLLQELWREYRNAAGFGAIISE